MCDCDGCQTIRLQASLLANVSLGMLPRSQVMHILAVLIAAMKHDFIEADREKEFDDLLADMIKVELEHICLANPIEPKKFDASFDFRNHIKDSK